MTMKWIVPPLKPTPREVERLTFKFLRDVGIEDPPRSAAELAERGAGIKAHIEDLLASIAKGGHKL